MSVYVDSMRAKYGRMVMCHMSADSRKELMDMADIIGVDRKWLQSQNRWDEHFDISLAKRRDAITAGAVEVTTRDMVRKMKARPALPCPECQEGCCT